MVDTFVDRMVGRFAREQVNLAEKRYASVACANDQILEEIRQEWQEELTVAVGMARRWTQWKEACLKLPKTANSRFVLAKYAWLCQRAYYLAEAMSFLSSGRAAYIAAWRDGRFKGSKAYLLSKFA